MLNVPKQSYRIRNDKELNIAHTGFGLYTELTQIICPISLQDIRNTISILLGICMIPVLEIFSISFSALAKLIKQFTYLNWSL